MYVCVYIYEWPSWKERKSGRPRREGERTGGQKRGALGVEARSTRSRTESTETELSRTPWPGESKVARREENNVNKGGGAEESQISLEPGTTSTKQQKIHMASSKTSNRKSMGAEIGNLASLALSRLFGEDEEIMEIDSPTLSLKRLLEEKTKNKSKGGAHGKRTRESAKASSSQMDPAEGSDSAHLTKFHFWLGFEAIERIAKEKGIAELFTDETIADRVTRGIPRKEAEELESVSISYPRVPQTLHRSERSDGIKGQHLNLTQLPQDIEIDPISKFSKDFHDAIHFQLPNNPLLHNQVKELVKERLKDMQILLGTSLIEPISVLCMSVKRGGPKEYGPGLILA